MLMDKNAGILWKRESSEYRYYRSLGAVGDVSGSGILMLGILTDEGLFECIDITTGTVRWSLNLGLKSYSAAIAAGDIDSDDRDEFIAGLPDGRLMAIQESDRGGEILWEKTFEAAIGYSIIADVDGDGTAEIVLSTSDGYIRVLEGKR